MNQKRLLVIRLSSLGDVVLTAPVYRNVKEFWPDCSISLLVKPGFAAALAQNPHIDEIIPFEGILKTSRLLRERGFTHLLDLHATFRSFLLRRLIRVSNTVVYKKSALARRLYVLFRWSSPELTKHVLERYLDALAAWGIPGKHRSLELGDFSSAQGRKSFPNAPSKIRLLIAQTSFLGDALLTVPLAKKIKEIFPKSHLAVLTRPETSSVFSSSPWVDEVIEQDKAGRHGGIGGLFSLARTLREKNFDAALGTHRSFRTALLLRLAGIGRRIGFTASPGAFFYHETVYFPWAMPDLERNLALLSPLQKGLKIKSADSLYLAESRGEETRKARERVAAMLEEAGVQPGQKIAALHPGSVWETKRWLPERYAKLAARLKNELGATVMLVGGPKDKELAARVEKESGVELLNWVGKTNLPELIAAARRWSVLVTNDSGPMHVAAASGVPTIALFGPTTKELGFFPYGDGHRVIEKELACRPCGLHGAKACPEGHFLCMKLISVDEVFSAAKAAL